MAVLVARANGASRAAAALGALVMAFGAAFWHFSVLAEVYTLAAALLLAIVYWLVRWRHSGADAHLFAAAGCFALAIGNHLSIVAAAPAIALFLLATSARRVLRWRVLVPAALIVASGFLQYAYILIRTRERSRYLEARAARSPSSSTSCAPANIRTTLRIQLGPVRPRTPARLRSTRARRDRPDRHRSRRRRPDRPAPARSARGAPAVTDVCGPRPVRRQSGRRSPRLPRRAARARAADDRGGCRRHVVAVRASHEPRVAGCRAGDHPVPAIPRRCCAPTSPPTIGVRVRKRPASSARFSRTSRRVPRCCPRTTWPTTSSPTCRARNAGAGADDRPAPHGPGYRARAVRVGHADLRARCAARRAGAAWISFRAGGSGGGTRLCRPA